MSAIATANAEPQTPSTSPATPSLYSSSEPPPSLTLSGTSVASLLSSGSPCEIFPSAIPFRRRGYVKPQATNFADSARNRQSVMNLGSIAHIQHYFARTGLLEGKGGHVAQGPIKIVSDDADKENFSPPSLLADFDDKPNESTLQYLHPTASTYRQVPILAPPPPNIDALRRELREALADAKSVLASLQPDEDTKDDHVTTSQGWHEVEGAHVLDLVTLALRAAKEYYVCHPCPAHLFRIRSERQLRADAHRVMDVLKVVASRNFRGGYRLAEVKIITEWIGGIGKLIDQDEAAERADRSRHDLWPWMAGDWTGRERERERSFLDSFVPEGHCAPLPEWLEPDASAPDAPLFLSKLRNGVKLIMLHNALVQASKRRFGVIAKHHADTDKPYRRSENLRYWIKAAELRWDVKLEVPVNVLVASDDLEAWKAFDQALLRWCRAVREELTAEYGGEERTGY